MKSLLNITLEEYLEFAREEGKEEALKEAEEKLALARKMKEEARQEKLETARKMKEGGLSISQIKTFTGLSSGVIEKL